MLIIDKYLDKKSNSCPVSWSGFIFKDQIKFKEYKNEILDYYNKLILIKISKNEFILKAKNNKKIW